MKSVKSLGHFNNNKATNRTNPLINSVSDISGSQNFENGVRISSRSGQNVNFAAEQNKLPINLPYIQSSYYPSKTLRSVSQKSKNRNQFNSNQQLVSQEYSINQIKNHWTTENSHNMLKHGQYKGILNMDSFQIIGNSQNSFNAEKIVKKDTSNSQIKMATNIPKNSLKIQKLKNSSFIQNLNERESNEEGLNSSRSVYDKILNDYALKPSYTSTSAQIIKNQVNNSEKYIRSDKVPFNNLEISYKRTNQLSEPNYSKSPRHSQ